MTGTEHLPNSKDSRTIPETQGSIGWVPPAGTLGQLVASAAVRSASLEPRRSELERLALLTAQAPSLRQALRRDDLALIAEIKRSSPSRGALRRELDSGAQASAYARGGAAAISVLTEPDSFGGTDEDIHAARSAVRIPILKKDFHVSVAQIYQARALGASAALLIARALSPELFRELVKAADFVGLEIVVEVRDLRELGQALDSAAGIIGVNNRNLETLEIEPQTADAIIPLIPRDCVAIAESGYSDRRSIEAVAACGADAVLIGSFLSAAEDPESDLRRLTGVRRISGGR